MMKPPMTRPVRAFTPLPLVQRSMSDILLRRQPRENAFIAINNLLASATSVRDISPLDVLRICDEYDTDMRGPLGSRLERLYSDYLLFCLADHHLSDAELRDLAHLKAVLRIDDASALRIHDHAARQVFGRTVDDVLADGIVDDGERAFLNTLQQDLALSGTTAARILATRARQRAAL